MGLNLTNKKPLNKISKTSKFSSKSEAGFNFTEEISINEISENLNVLLLKCGEGQFYKRNP